jgi:hypothetical protein
LDVKTPTTLVVLTALVLVPALLLGACGDDGPTVALLGGGEVSGTGKMVDIEVSGGAPAIITVSIRGSSTYGVTLHVDSRDWDANLAGGAGRYLYEGVHFSECLETGHLEIRASGGTWTVQVEPLTAAPSIPASGRFEGEGDTVLVDSSPPTSPFVVSFTHEGEHNFAVEAWNGTGYALLANAVGPYEGSTVGVAAGTAIYDITADGTWTLEIER